MMRPMEEDEITIITPEGSPLSPVEVQIQQQIKERTGEDEPALIEEVQDVKLKPIWKGVLKSSTFHALVFILFFIVCIPTLIFLFVIERDPPIRLGISSCSVEPGYRVSCGQWNISRPYCLSIRCCHDEERNECFHYIPSKYGYSTGGEDEINPGSGGSGGRFMASPQYTTLGSRSVKELKLTVQEIDSERVKLILHEPEDIVEEIIITDTKGYTISMYEDFLGIEIHRLEPPEKLLLTTGLGPLMASDPYWEWTFQMTSTYLFGMGGLLIEPNATVNQTFYPNRHNHILQQPMFLAQTQDEWHSVLIDWVGGPLEVTVLPSRLIVLRMIGGGRIELTLGVGPDPKNAANQMRFSEEEMEVPPRWMLGLHMCRDGVTTLQEAIREYVEFYSAGNGRVLKFETDCIHENLFLMLANDDPDANKISDLAKALQPRVVNNILLSIPAQIPVGSNLFNEATTLDILYKDGAENEYVNASYNGLNVAYPDYDSESISTYMAIVQTIVDEIGRKGPIVGFVLRDNWPDADNIYFEDENQFPYMTEGLTKALSNTLPYTSTSTSSPISHYLFHRSYSTSHLTTIRTLTTSNPPIYLTSSLGNPTKPQSQNLYAHLQHVNATWEEFRWVLHYTLYHSMFNVGGTGLVAAPVCGSGDLWDERLQGELCVRWWLFAATTPLVRVSSAGLRRDPESFSSRTSKSLVLRTLRHRTALLPYYYTILAQRQPLLRPVFYDYPADTVTYALDDQYLVGDALMVAQPLVPNMVVQRVYLPRRNKCGGWYEYWEGTLYDDVEEEKGRKSPRADEKMDGQWVEVPIVASDWVMFIASGSILPRAKESSEDTFNLLLATGKESCQIIKAEMLFKTTSLYMEADQSKFTISNILAVKSEICGGEVQATSLHIIESVYIYGRFTQGVQLAPVAINLCEFTDDVLAINISNGPPVITP